MTGLNKNIASLKQRIKNCIQQHQAEEALVLARELCSKEGASDSESWLLLAGVHSRLGNLSDLKECCEHALQLNPGLLQAHFNLALVEQMLGNPDAAVQAYRKVLDLNPAHPGVHANLGICLLRAGDKQAAIEYLQTAASVQPGNAEIHYYLGLALSATGRLEDAAQTYREAIHFSPGDVRLQNNLGSVLYTLGETGRAVDAFKQAILCDPESVQGHYNLSIVYWSQGSSQEAYAHCRAALRLDPDSLPVRQSFVQLLSQLPLHEWGDEEYREVARCFSVQGVDAAQLISACAGYFRGNEVYAQLLAQTEAGDIADIHQGLQNGAYRSLFDDPLLTSLLRKAVVAGEDVENILTAVRHALLLFSLDEASSQDAAARLIGFASALAAQCFNNEYVFGLGDAEQMLLHNLDSLLSERVDQGWPRDQRVLLGLLVAAMYQPLGSRSWADSLSDIDNGQIHEDLRFVLQQQLLEPEQELQLRNSMHTFGDISDATSRVVRAQYEDNPYPRWSTATRFLPRRPEEVIKQMFPWLGTPTFPDHLDMLIAGCGTGKQVVMSATRFADVNVLAVDLSLNSLAYAKRQVQEFGVDNVEFAQGDILQLTGLKRKFHLIESVGVLHHMADPASGLKILAEKLHPGGLINIGLYSTIARRNIDKARQFVKQHGYVQQNDDIRKSRQAILALEKDDPVRAVAGVSDFYSISECRDLLFHVQETAYTTLELKKLLNVAGLDFIGFEFNDQTVRHRYRQGFPDDKTMTDLDNWHRFEQEFPDTFADMYTFWCRSPGVS